MAMDRRNFLKASAAAVAAAVADRTFAADFHKPDSLYHGDEWESLNPGYWKLESNALRRRIHNYGDRARKTGFPYHYETHADTLGSATMPVDYDPTLPPGFIWRRDWKLTGNYKLRMEGRIKALPHAPQNGDKPSWQMYQPGYGLLGLAFGSATLFESFGQGGQDGKAAWFAAWRDDGQFGLYDHGPGDAPAAPRATAAPKAGDVLAIEVEVSGADRERADLRAALTIGSDKHTVAVAGVNRKQQTEGFVGIVGQGLLDFEITGFEVFPDRNEPLKPAINECHVCYPLGDTLKQVDGKWQVRFISLFRNDGEWAEVRIAATENPPQGWASVSSAGRGRIISNDFRVNTAVIDAVLPANPADTALYYTIWKDGRNVTTDPRLGTDAVGAGTAMVGKVPSSGSYVGRLPRLEAPYRLCGLSCHAISGGGPKLPDAAMGGGFWVHDQPTPDAYQHLDDYGFQVMMWEDDVWYMELLLYPPSVDDAFKVVTTTICGPTTRWQMMRHWNTLNPGDHDYGMDDVKGPEQIIIRNHAHLGQDPDYMRRNFQTVHHLVTGDEHPSGTENPKKWRRWKMPNRDFSLLILDSRLWRSSQDTNIWDDQGWGGEQSLYSRKDVTRSLLGEEQFAWLKETIQTDSSPLICLTGINGMHTIWTGNASRADYKTELGERDRVAADYAGWVSAGADRVLEVLGSRDGVISVYGDVHAGMISRNVDQRLYECSFGPIGRSGGRGVKEGFGPRMKDFDGRDVEIRALYHQSYDTPDLQKLDGPYYWNFLEMVFDPRGTEPAFELKLRNLIDAPSQTPRGGSDVAERAANTGRPLTCRIEQLKVLPDADVLFADADGRPLRGARSQSDGSVAVAGLIGPKPGEEIIVTSRRGAQTSAKVVRARSG